MHAITICIWELFLLTLQGSRVIHHTESTSCSCLLQRQVRVLVKIPWKPYGLMYHVEKQKMGGENQIFKLKAIFLLVPYLIHVYQAPSPNEAGVRHTSWPVSRATHSSRCGVSGVLCCHGDDIWLFSFLQFKCQASRDCFAWALLCQELDNGDKKMLLLLCLEGYTYFSVNDEILFWLDKDDARLRKLIWKWCWYRQLSVIMMVIIFHVVSGWVFLLPSLLWCLWLLYWQRWMCVMILMIDTSFLGWSKERLSCPFFLS